MDKQSKATAREYFQAHRMEYAAYTLTAEGQAKGKATVSFLYVGMALISLATLALSLVQW
jgi:hypothetical protein